MVISQVIPNENRMLLPRAVALEVLVFLNESDVDRAKFTKSAEHNLSTILGGAPVEVMIAKPTGNHLVVFDKLNGVPIDLADQLMQKIADTVMAWFDVKGKVEVRFGPITMKY